MTTQAKHTPGPWAANDDGLVLGNLDNYEGEAPLVCTCGSADDFKMEPDLHLANARLIASAPELLEALRAMVARGPFMDQSATAEGLANCEALAKARHAIRQAEGAQ
jgi:hypothetical protein